MKSLASSNRWLIPLFATACLAAACIALPSLAWQDSPAESSQRHRTYVTDYGAIPNDGQDDGPAVARLLTEIRSSIAAGQFSQVTVHFPGGVYDFDRNNPLHALIQEDGTYADAKLLPPHGIHFTGDAQNYSVLKLHRSSGNARWFCDSSPTAGGGPSWRRAQFDDLWFASDAPDAFTDFKYDATYAADCNGFRQHATTASGAVDKAYTFRNCRFNGLGNAHRFSGDAASESNNHYSCWYSNCGRAAVWENDQALLNNWYSCHFYSPDDCFEILATAGMGQTGQGGGGAIALYSCDFVQANVLGDTTPHYVLRIADGAAFYRQIQVLGAHFEFRNPEARLLKWPGTASALTGSEVTFRDCDLSVAQQGRPSYGGAGHDLGYASSSLNGYRYFVSMGPFKRVNFDRCALPDQWAIEFTDVNPASVVGYGHQPVVEMRGCMLPFKFLTGLNDAGTADESTRGINSRISLSNGYGRVISTDGYLRDATDATAVRMACDFDYGGQAAVRGEPGARRFRVYLKAGPQAWPTSGSTRRLLLPYGARVVAAGFDAPASGLQSATTYYQIANGDGTFVYTRSRSARGDAAHQAVASEFTKPGKFPRTVTSVNERFIELSQPTGNAVNKSGGSAWVEYY